MYFLSYISQIILINTSRGKTKIRTMKDFKLRGSSYRDLTVHFLVLI